MGIKNIFVNICSLKGVGIMDKNTKNIIYRLCLCAVVIVLSFVFYTVIDSASIVGSDPVIEAALKLIAKSVLAAADLISITIIAVFFRR